MGLAVSSAPVARRRLRQFDLIKRRAVFCSAIFWTFSYLLFIQSFTQAETACATVNRSMTALKPHLLTNTQLERFHEDGFLVVENFFTDNELQPVIDWINEEVSSLAEELYKAGKIKNKFENEGFYYRLTKLDEVFPGASVLLHKKGQLKSALANLWTNPRLLDVIEQILGPDIAGHPVWNLRTKTPRNPLATVPWHQDTAYLKPGAEGTFQPTAWIPLIDANVQNGCMQVKKGAHRTGKVATHTCCVGESWYIAIDEEELERTFPNCETVTCEVKKGGFLLLNQLTPHRSLPNLSDKIRWSVDLRWQRPNEPHGFFGIKDPILFRTSKDPNYKIQWGNWVNEDRNKINIELLKQKGHVESGLSEDDDRFSPIIAGPWMSRWKIVHHNAHTNFFTTHNTDEKKWTKS
jgi:hypothetical protein